MNVRFYAEKALRATHALARQVGLSSAACADQASVLESRGILRRLPRAGTRIQSFGTEVQIGRKASYRRSWVFDLDEGDILCLSSTVDIAFDTGSRRSIEIPLATRERLESQCHPDLL